MPTASARLPRTAASSTRTKYSACLLHWLLERKKWPGDVVRAFNTTRMLDRIAAKYGRKIARDQHRIQVHCRPDDGTRNSDRRRRVWRDRLSPVSSGTRWYAQLPAAGQCDGGRGQAARPVGCGSAAGIRSALLRPARSAHCRSDQAGRHCSAPDADDTESSDATPCSKKKISMA